MKLAFGRPARSAAHDRGGAAAGHMQAVAAVTLGVAVASRLPAEAVRRPAGTARGRQIPVRSLGAYLAVVALDLPQAAVARALGMQRDSVWRLVRRVEDRREDPGCDAALDAATEEMCPA